MSVIRATASLDAVGMMEASGVAVNWGNLKFMLAANLCPSGHSLESGVPSTEQILNISSISELPGNRGLEQQMFIIILDFMKLFWFLDIIISSSMNI